MLPLDVDYLARRERCQNLMREAEHERLVQEVRHGQYGHWKAQRRKVGWLKSQMMRWGAKLHLL